MKRGHFASEVLLPIVPRAAPGAEFGCDDPKSVSSVARHATSIDEPETWALELLIAQGFHI